MFQCSECEREFEEPKKYVEKHGLDTPPYEEYFGCPYCGGYFEEKEENEV